MLCQRAAARAPGPIAEYRTGPVPATAARCAASNAATSTEATRGGALAQPTASVVSVANRAQELRCRIVRPLSQPLRAASATGIAIGVPCLRACAHPVALAL